jgi:fatty-acyl-CoA synthase
MEGTMMSYPLTLVHILERGGRFFPKSEIVSRLPDKSLHRQTFGDFYRRARALGAALTQAGLRRGDRVATLMWNHYAHHEAYFGVPCAGGVLHTLNLRLHPDDIAFVAGHAGDRFLIVDDVLLPLYEKFKDRIDIEKVIVVPLTKQPVTAVYTDYEKFIASGERGFEYPDLDESEAAGICYTSGTTGRPKGVVYTHRALVLHSLGSALKNCLGLAEDDVVCPVVPMFHVNAWGIPFTATMTGSKLVFPGPHLDAVNLLDLFQSERVTLSAGVPTIWAGILQALEKNPERWKLTSGLRMVVGGAAAPEAMIRAYDKFNLRVLHAWGMTETTPLGTFNFVKKHLHTDAEEVYTLRAKQGLPVPLVEVRTMSEAGAAPWDGRTLGELQVRGPWVAQSYFNLEEESDKWTQDGWFRTGDVAAIDAEGYVKITDRTKDLIKSGGEWISSVDLENALTGHPAVQEAAVIAAVHPKWDERPLAVVVLKAGQQASADELRKFLEPKFAKFWLPDAFVFVNEIARTSTGKMMKAKLREQYRHWQWE